MARGISGSFVPWFAPWAQTKGTISTSLDDLQQMLGHWDPGIALRRSKGPLPC